MKIKSKFLIEKAASKDATRYAIQSVYIENQQAIATNGRIMAIVPCEHSDTENQKLIGVDTFKAIRSGQKEFAKSWNILEAELNGEIKWKTDGESECSSKYSGCQFPNYKQCDVPADRPNTHKIRFDIDLLNDLVAALGKKTNGNAYVTLDFTDSKSPIRVTTSGEGHGVIMPVLLA